MCYDSLSLTKRALDYAQRIGYSDETIQELEEHFLRIRETQGPVFHASGYSHPTFPIVSDAQKLAVEPHLWGLIPSWVKDKEQATRIWNNTINARSESLLEKPSFRGAVKKGRCLVVTDGFFEHHHKAGKSIPYLIRHRDEGPMILAGLKEEWTDPESQKIWRSFTIVTTTANKLLSQIQNKPKLNQSRMPVILDREAQQLWLEDWQEQNPEERIHYLCKAYPDDDLKAHTVQALRGKKALGNVAETLDEVTYPELVEDDANDTGQMELF
ncbi:SOS response-associated peptidase [Croceimicrobium sp.]|uniref:SOS response-associated peptidase n=1 Tax=Croceimicrobium sp. TaxID=2828340 RepID=UPI003BACF6D3